ncbi:hypothetical protein AB0H42_04080 [Nocardia sp. NPDC050799]|uniref:hypothetical protein n=1 Tax=Nocardia sp. NPDC050799 TaxID=3154842 RepID=UPI0033C4A4BA
MDSNVTDLRTRTRYRPDFGTLARNRVAAARVSMGLTEREFARVLTSLVGREITAGLVSSWETSVTPPGDIVVAASSVSPNSTVRLGVRSHKFISVQADQEAVAELCTGDGDRTSLPINDQCTLYAWPFGSVILHLVEDLEFPDVTSLAFWRYETYPENLEWAAEQVSELTGKSAIGSYVLSLYWVHSPIWSGRILDTALKIICSPRVLLESDRDAAGAERELLAEGFEHAEMRPFGVQGVSVGYASWSGVVYHAFDDRALTEDQIVAAELDVQSIWSYCAHIADSIERGEEPEIHPGYGAGFIRASRSRLLTPRPQESDAHRSMRDAIVQTSGLPLHLSNAIDTLKDIGVK